MLGKLFLLIEEVLFLTDIFKQVLYIYYFIIFLMKKYQ